MAHVATWPACNTATVVPFLKRGLETFPLVWKPYLNVTALPKMTPGEREQRRQTLSIPNPFSHFSPRPWRFWKTLN